LALAPIVLVVLAVTAIVVTVKVAVLDPAGTVTFAGTDAALPLAVNATTKPPVGALPLSVTVPVEGLPPETDAGLTDTLTRLGGVIVKVAVWFVPFSVPVIVADVDEATPKVETVNVAVVAPAATVTEVGTVAFEVLEPSDTTVPPVAAGPERVTVPVDGVPPGTDVGLRVTLSSVAGVIVKVAV